MKASDYKAMVGLGKNTALISEKARANLIKTGKSRFDNLKKGKKHSEETKEKIRKGLMEYQSSMEAKNASGTCPEQLIDRLVRLAERLGRTPRIAEVTFYQTLIKVYGSYEKACRLAGLKHRKNGQNVRHSHGVRNFDEGLVIRNGRRVYSDQYLLQRLVEFEKEHGREASWSDCQRRLLPSHRTYKTRFGSFQKAKDTAKEMK